MSATQRTWFSPSSPRTSYIISCWKLITMFSLSAPLPKSIRRSQSGPTPRAPLHTGHHRQAIVSPNFGDLALDDWSWPLKFMHSRMYDRPGLGVPSRMPGGVNNLPPPWLLCLSSWAKPSAGTAARRSDRSMGAKLQVGTDAWEASPLRTAAEIPAVEDAYRIRPRQDGSNQPPSAT